MRRTGAFFALLIAGFALPAVAQIDSREGIALQNQILQLRQEIEMLRRGGVSAAPAPRPSTGGGAPQGELVGNLLERVQRMEEELRSVRGRAEQAEFRERQLREQVEKLQGDMDFRLQQLEGGRPGGAPPRPAAASPPPASSPPPAAQAQPAATPSRTPQRALADGMAALGRRDYRMAEAAAREVIASRETARMGDAYILLGDSLAGRREFAGAAVAYDDALRRSPQGSRAPEAMLGIANSLIGLNNNRDACAQLADLRSKYPNLSGSMAERAAEARRRAQCR
jgi:TolA-binding protein